MRLRKVNDRNTVGQSNARCSFCGKLRDQVKRLIMGPGVTICDQCIGICTEILTGPSQGLDVTCQR